LFPYLRGLTSMRVLSRDKRTAVDTILSRIESPWARFLGRAVVPLAFAFLAVLRLYDFTGGFQYCDASLYNYWAAGNNLTIANDSIPWLQIYVTRGFFTLLGTNEFSSRLYAAICGLLLLVGVYFLGRRLSGEYGGLLSMLVVGLSPLVIEFSRINALDVPLALWLTLATYYSLNAAKSVRSTALCGVFCGLAFFTKYTGLVGVALLGYIVLTARRRSASIGFLTFGLVTAPLWYQLAVLNWHPFVFHASLSELVPPWSVAGDALSDLLQDIGPILPAGIVAFTVAALAHRLDRRVLAPALLLVSIFASFLIIRRWNSWYVIDFLPFLAVVAAYSLTKIYGLSHKKILRLCIIGGVILILVINGLAATSFVATFTGNNSWKVVGGVAQGYAELYNCSIVSRDWEALWYFRNMQWQPLDWVRRAHPERFIVVSYDFYLSRIEEYLGRSGMTFHETIIWRSPTDDVTMWLFTT